MFENRENSRWPLLYGKWCENANTWEGGQKSHVTQSTWCFHFILNQFVISDYAQAHCRVDFEKPNDVCESTGVKRHYSVL